MITLNENNNTATIDKEKEKFSADNYFEKLEKISKNAISASSKLTYYFEDRDSNKLRNVISTQMLNEDYTKYHKHDFFEMNFVFKGSLYENIGGKSFTLSKGDLLFMSPSIYHTCCPSSDALCFNILFSKDFILGG